MIYEVRTKGDDDQEYIVAPNTDNKHYNPERLQEAIEYAKSIKGYVVKIEETEVFNAEG